MHPKAGSYPVYVCMLTIQFLTSMDAAATTWRFAKRSGKPSFFQVTIWTPTRAGNTLSSQHLKWRSWGVFGGLLAL